MIFVCFLTKREQKREHEIKENDPRSSAHEDSHRSAIVSAKAPPQDDRSGRRQLFKGKWLE